MTDDGQEYEPFGSTPVWAAAKRENTLNVDAGGPATDVARLVSGSPALVSSSESYSACVTPPFHTDGS